MQPIEAARRMRRCFSVRRLCLFLVSILGIPAQAQLRPLPSPANPGLPSVFFIGDSTVRNGKGDGGNGQWGWADPIADLFDSGKINVVNRAVGGLSSRTYRTSGYWEATLPLLKAGDYLLMQFGHNDDSPLNDKDRARGTIRSSGDESEEIDNMLTGKRETVHSYGWYLRQYIQEARAKGAHPIVCSPIPRKSWTGEKVNRANNSYGLWAKQVAESEGVPFIDLNEIVARTYESMGKEAVEAMFADEHTHTSRQGAELNARSVVAGLLALPNCGLVQFLSEAGQKVEPAPSGTVAVEDERPILDDSKPEQSVGLNTSNPTFYIMGDSTVRNGNSGGVGWGEVIAKHFNTQEINVVNRAIGGRSTRTYMREKKWDDIYNILKPGDFVIMQFGHNDGGKVGDPRFKGRPALPGIGDDTQIDTLADGTSEVVHSYGWYLIQFCKGVKEKGATAIICSPVPHKNDWKDGVFTPDFPNHRKWCQQAAEATNAYFIDLTAIVAQHYQSLGEEQVDKLFADARTHTNRAGAELNAKCVIEGLRNLEGEPLKPFLAQ